MEAPALPLVEDEVLVQEMLATEFADAGFERCGSDRGDAGLAIRRRWQPARASSSARP